jgi:hypothetical protein
MFDEQQQRESTLDSFTDRLYACLDDGEICESLAELIKTTLFDEYKCCASKAERIAKLCNQLFPNELPKAPVYEINTPGSSRTLLSVDLPTPDYWHLVNLAAAKKQCVMDYLQDLVNTHIKESKNV